MGYKSEIKFALDTFYNLDSFLAKNNVFERAMTHRLAVYLEHPCNDTYYPNQDARYGVRLNIDCEYGFWVEHARLIVSATRAVLREMNTDVDSIRSLVSQYDDRNMNEEITEDEIRNLIEQFDPERIEYDQETDEYYITIRKLGAKRGKRHRIFPDIVKHERCACVDMPCRHRKIYAIEAKTHKNYTAVDEIADKGKLLALKRLGFQHAYFVLFGSDRASYRVDEV